MPRAKVTNEFSATTKLHHTLGLALNEFSKARKSLDHKESPDAYLRETINCTYKCWQQLLPKADRKKVKANIATTRMLRKVKKTVEKATIGAENLLEILAQEELNGKKITKKLRREYTLNAMKHVQRILDKTSMVTARIPVEELLRPITGKGTEITDVSFDIYCPKAYKHHTRLTIWMPRIMAHGDHTAKALKKGRAMLKACGVRGVNQYVIGINSRVNQYKEQHLLMLDFDDLPYEDLPLNVIKSEPGILLRTERGFHFLGLHLYDLNEWKKKLRGLRKVAEDDHIDLSLQRGYGTLRMSASPRKPFAPIVFERWTGKN